MSIRVGRMIGKNKPSFDGYKPIVVLTKSSPYGELGPYVLKDENDQIMENIWQFSKVYEKVPKSTQRCSQYDSTIIWDWPAEVHVENDIPNDKYWKWREEGMKCQYAVRYPVGMKARSECLYCLWPTGNFDLDGGDEYEELDYVEARKKIYVNVYTDLVKEQPKFDKLKKMLKNGDNLLIIEVDGPHQESLDYYKEKYNVNNDFIVDDTILATKENLTIMLNDTKHPYGHGYCLATALLDFDLK